MKLLKIGVIACSLSAAVAHAQTAPAEPEQQTAQANAPRADNVAVQDHIAIPKAKAKECVGPVSFCNTFFGS